MSDPIIPGTPPSSAAPAGPATAAAKPTAPAKPAGKAGKGDTRRGFINWFATAWVAFVAAMGVFALGTLRFLMPNLSETPGKIKVGFTDNFEEGKVNEKYKSEKIWLVRNEGKLYALSTTCTHLGCTPNWLEREAKFKCPCHGSGFYMSGINFEGPAPRPLERWGILIGDDGQVVVDQSKKFQQERGEWDNPESFIKV